MPSAESTSNGLAADTVSDVSLHLMVSLLVFTTAYQVFCMDVDVSHALGSRSNHNRASTDDSEADARQCENLLCALEGSPSIDLETPDLGTPDLVVCLECLSAYVHTLTFCRCPTAQVRQLFNDPSGILAARLEVQVLPVPSPNCTCKRPRQVQLTDVQAASTSNLCQQ